MVEDLFIFPTTSRFINSLPKNMSEPGHGYPPGKSMHSLIHPFIHHSDTHLAPPVIHY